MTDLNYWLKWIKGYHDQAINYGLDHVRAAAQKLELTAFDSIVISVAGTNGKGSCIACMEAILLAQGHKVAAYTSPHMFSFNERIRINGAPVADAAICAAMQQVQDLLISNPDLKLSLFEFVTLAALLIFKRAAPDYMLLEVGLGGRLDAVNVVQNNVAIITSIALDHCKYLGNTLEAIAFEKAGIIQPQSKAIYAAANPPQAVRQSCAQQQIKLHAYGAAYKITELQNCWQFATSCGSIALQNLPLLSFALSNAAAAIYALSLVSKQQLPATTVNTALGDLKIAGRMQIETYNEHEIIFDVAHNPAAVQWLVDQIKRRTCYAVTQVILGVAASKDLRAMLLNWNIIVDTWYICEPAAMRHATPAPVLEQTLRATQQGTISVMPNAAAALTQALNKTSAARTIVFGSFHTVAEALQGLNRILEHDRIYVG